MTQNADLGVAIKAMLTEHPMGPTETIETLCSGPQEPAVRRAIWQLIYDEGVQMDDKRRLLLAPNNRPVS